MEGSKVSSKQEDEVEVGCLCHVPLLP